MKMKGIHRILVPCDLMIEGKVALHHAAVIAAPNNAHVILLHLIKEASQWGEAEVKMKQWVQSMREIYSGEVSSLVEMGDFVDQIGIIARRESCQFVVMPTHGMRGWQKVTGSLALKVVSQSKLPFVIVQERDVHPTGYERMVVPINFRPQVMEEIPFIIQLAKMFDSKVFLVAPPQDSELYSETLLKEVEATFQSAEVSWEIYHVESGSNFSHAVVRHAAAVQADLICAVNFSYEYLYTLFPRAEEEALIYNDAEIPVMLITPEQQDDMVYTVPLWH
jgi:nucleotide-binding universal stress UspA family protein